MATPCHTPMEGKDGGGGADSVPKSSDARFGDHQSSKTKELQQQPHHHFGGADGERSWGSEGEGEGVGKLRRTGKLKKLLERVVDEGSRHTKGDIVAMGTCSLMEGEV
jgi:hypothetical protein